MLDQSRTSNDCFAPSAGVELTKGLATRRRLVQAGSECGRASPEFGEEGEVGSQTQVTRNHRSAAILVGGISVAAAVPEHQ